jgi:hypothetical protein
MRFDQILQRLTPNAQYSFETTEQSYMSRKPGDTTPVLRTEQAPILDSYAAIIWADVAKQPTLVECEAEWLILQKENSDSVIDDTRRSEYGSISDQLDMMYWDTVNGTTTWVDHVAAVKQNNPKD